MQKWNRNSNILGSGFICYSATPVPAFFFTFPLRYVSEYGVHLSFNGKKMTSGSQILVASDAMSLYLSESLPSLNNSLPFREVRKLSYLILYLILSNSDSLSFYGCYIVSLKDMIFRNTLEYQFQDL